MAEVKFNDTNAGGQAPSPGAAAYACSRLGFQVFPLVPGIGTPAIKEYSDYATADPEVIQAWWTGDYSGYGVGIATGPESDLWVLDIDTKKGVDGFDAWANLIIRHGRIPNTMMVKTPSGGAHVYFRWSEGVVNSTSRLGPGLDVRGHHGYVRAPGWSGYDVIAYNGKRGTKVSEAPAWLVKLAQKRQRNYAEDQGAPGTSWARFSTTRTLAVLEGAPEGTRNNALNKAAFKMGVSGAVDEGEAWKACRAVMTGIGAGDDEAAQRRTFESGWNAGVEARGRSVG